MQTNNNLRTDNIFYLLIAFFSFALCSLSYSPFLMSFGEYSPVRKIFSIVAFSIFILIVLAKFSVFLRYLTNIRLIPVYIFSLFGALLCMLMFFDRMFIEFYNFSLPFFPFIAGICLTFKESTIRKIFFLYCIISAIIALSLVLTGGASFEVSSTYWLNAKNSICVIWGICAVGLFYFALSTKFKLLNILELILSACFCLFTLMGQGRAAMVATAFIGGWIFLKNFKNLDATKIVIIAASSIVLSLLFVVLLSQIGVIADYISASFVSGRDASDLNSLSSGRVEVYKAALLSFFKNPISGILSSTGFLIELPWVHNYPLRILYEYGLLFGVPFLLTYTVVSCMLIKGFLKISKEYIPTHTNLGYYLVGFLFIISMLEPTYPWAPGTVTAIAFFFFGYTIKSNYNIGKMGNKIPQMQPTMPLPPMMYHNHRRY